MIKISTGSKKGITLASTKTVRQLRPTTSLIREAIVQILDNRGDGIAGSNVLDIFSGIGTVGFELLSNGASSVTFLEKDPKCARVIRSNIKNLAFEKQAKVLVKSAVEAVSRLSAQDESEQFDIVFADPPYEKSSQFFATICNKLLEMDLIKSGGTLVWESAAKDKPDLNSVNTNQRLALIKEKKYGDTLISFFELV